MKIIILDKILFSESILGITIFPFVFMKKGKDTLTVINHESIHIKQQIELLVIPFYILYFLFWLFNVIKNSDDPYRNIPFEKESYENENDMEYLNKRKLFSWIKYI